MKSNKCLFTMAMIIGMILVFAGNGFTSEKPIKIGILLPYSGTYAILGKTIDAAMEVCLEDSKYEAGGRKLVLIREDTEMNPKMGLTKARKLIERDRVDMLAGIVSSSVAYALRDYVVSQKVPTIIANAGAQGLTREKGSKYIFRASFANGQYTRPLGPYSVEKLGLRRMAVICPNYAAGHEKAKAFIGSFTGAGGSVTEELYPKLGTEDFGPYLTKLGDADGVFAFHAGNDAIKFVKQYSGYGLKKKMQLVADGSVTDELFLNSLGDAAIGIITGLHYAPSLDNPVNKKFVKAYKAKVNREPNGFARQGYCTAGVIIHALNATKGNIDNKDKLLKAIKDVEFDDAGGRFRFNKETQNIIFDVYIRKVERIDGELVNKVIDVVKNVSDPWPEK